MEGRCGLSWVDGPLACAGYGAGRATTGGCPNGRFAERIYYEGEQELLTAFSNHLLHMGVIIETQQTPTVTSEP